ncbi:MAG: xanthine dehydrogenase family protein subunit M [Pseudomonadota bacterium]
MYEANYHRPSSLQEAAALLSGREEATLLAGGQTLLPTLKQHLAAPSDLIDLRGVAEMRGVRQDGDAIVIGAMTTHAEVSNHEMVRASVPSLAKLAGKIGDPAVRYLGTIGGSIANNDPAADYPAAMLALNATLITDKREIAAEDFFEGLFTTALDEGEILTGIKVRGAEKAAYSKFRNPASRYAMCGVFVAKHADGVRVAVTGAGEDGVFRHAGLEAALSADFSADAVKDVEIASHGLITDMHASPAYRANLIRVMTQRAVEAAQ